LKYTLKFSDNATLEHKQAFIQIVKDIACHMNKYLGRNASEICEGIVVCASIEKVWAAITQEKHYLTYCKDWMKSVKFKDQGSKDKVGSIKQVECVSNSSYEKKVLELSGKYIIFDFIRSKLQNEVCDAKF